MTPSSVLITGAAGFLGAAVARACRIAWPHARIVGADIRDGVPGVDVVCDLADRDAAAALVRTAEPEVLLHMVGVTEGSDWQTLWASHVLALANVLDGVVAGASGCTVVVPGSAAEYGEVPAIEGPILESRELLPTSPYGVSKVWQTVLARSYSSRGAQIVVGRVFNLAGIGVPRRLVLGAVAEQLRRIEARELPAVVQVGDLRAIRDFIDVDDACDALLALAIEGRPGEVYNVCSGSASTVGDVVRLLVEASGTGARIAASPAAASDRGNVSWSVGSNAKILAETHWSPRVRLADSLRNMLAQS